MKVSKINKKKNSGDLIKSDKYKYTTVADAMIVNINDLLNPSIIFEFRGLTIFLIIGNKIINPNETINHAINRVSVIIINLIVFQVLFYNPWR